MKAKDLRAMMSLFNAVFRLLEAFFKLFEKPKPNTGKNFYSSAAWRKLRYETLRDKGRTCIVCGQSAPDVEIHVDHIKPRSLYPELALDKDNVVPMCKDCNLGKMNRCEHDFR